PRLSRCPPPRPSIESGCPPVRRLPHLAAAAGAWHRRWMCRNIRVLHNFEPPATEDEIAAAALQYVRKVAGVTRPSAANEAAFDEAVRAVTEASADLLASMVTKAPRRDREVEATKAKARAAQRYARA